MGDWGRLTPPGAERVGPELYILQMRPLGSRNLGPKISRLEYAPEDVLCASASSLGHGIERNIRDIIYVRMDRWQAASNKVIAREIEQLNAALVKSRRRFLLIGPGRWGTADEWLGIPVRWQQISNAKVIIEASLLTDEEKVVACQLAKVAGADFVKTSTGFGPGGATADDVALMRRVVGPAMGVKAAGGIRTFEDAQKMIAAGASRLGASASVRIMQAAASPN